PPGLTGGVWTEAGLAGGGGGCRTPAGGGLGALGGPGGPGRGGRSGRGPPRPGVPGFAARGAGARAGGGAVPAGSPVRGARRRLGGRVLWGRGARQWPRQAVFQQYLAQSDVFIGLYWQGYGQLVPGAQVSGLEEEFQLSGGLPRLLYVKAPAPDREPRLADLLARIREEASASYRHFRTPAELGQLVRDDLPVLLSDPFAPAAGPAPAP